MKDGPIRRWIKWIARWRYLTDLKVTRVVSGLRTPPQFELKGLCEGCGRCCESPMIPVNPLIFRLKFLRRLFLGWHRVINGFEYRGESRQDYVFIFHCTHFDLETRLCDSYDSRPGLCRDYPRNQLDSVKPEFFDECGFYAVDKNAQAFRESLEATDLPPEKLEEIYEKLYLKED